LTFGHSGAQAERQSARMSKIKNGGLDQCKALTGSAVKGLILCNTCYVTLCEH